MRLNELLIYRIENDEYILNDLLAAYEHYGDEQDSEYVRELVYEAMGGLFEMAANHGFYGNIWHCYLTNLLVNNDNAYSRMTEIRGEISGTINKAVLQDMGIFKEIFDMDFTKMCTYLDIRGFELLKDYEPAMEESKVYNTRVRKRICDLAQAFGGAEDAKEMKSLLTNFYKEYGVGTYGLHKSFRIEDVEGHARIVPILNIAHVKLDDLVGYDIPKQQLIENTEAFIEGRKANNCLLYGDAGTGKSSSIKAITNAYYEQGLRVIEVYKHQFKLLNDLIGQIKNRNYRFIIYMDDLSFEDFEIEYKYLKAVIEGGLEKKPDNILIYATSNKRHLVNETFSEREDNLHATDAMQEKLSLVSRFGVTIYYPSPQKKEFDNIVLSLAHRNNLKLSDEELIDQANKWVMYHGSYSGRMAQQFIDNLLGRQK